MVLGIIGVAREAIEFSKHTVPVTALLAAFSFVSGLMLAVKKNAFTDESPGLQESLPEVSDRVKDG